MLQNVSSAAVITGALRVEMGLDARKPDFVVGEQQRPRPACRSA